MRYLLHKDRWPLTETYTVAFKWGSADFTQRVFFAWGRVPIEETVGKKLFPSFRDAFVKSGNLNLDCHWVTSTSLGLKIYSNV